LVGTKSGHIILVENNKIIKEHFLGYHLKPAQIINLNSKSSYILAYNYEEKTSVIFLFTFDYYSANDITFTITEHEKIDDFIDSITIN
jgi:hypothetical protein